MDVSKCNEVIQLVMLLCWHFLDLCKNDISPARLAEIWKVVYVDSSDVQFRFRNLKELELESEWAMYNRNVQSEPPPPCLQSSFVTNSFTDWLLLKCLICVYFQSSTACYESAIISEAHGLITDMLADSSLPPHVVSGLRAVSTLLKPPESHGPGTHKPKVSPLVSLTEATNYGSDNEDSPYTGERPSTLPKVNKLILLSHRILLNTVKGPGYYSVVSSVGCLFIAKWLGGWPATTQPPGYKKAPYTTVVVTSLSLSCLSLILSFYLWHKLWPGVSCRRAVRTYMYFGNLHTNMDENAQDWWTWHLIHIQSLCSRIVHMCIFPWQNRWAYFCTMMCRQYASMHSIERPSSITSPLLLWTEQTNSPGWFYYLDHWQGK